MLQEPRRMVPNLECELEEAVLGRMPVEGRGGLSRGENKESRMGRKSKKTGDARIHMAESLCRTAENNTTL